MNPELIHRASSVPHYSWRATALFRSSAQASVCAARIALRVPGRIRRQYRCKLRANAIAVATIMASGTIRSPPPGIRASDSIGRSISPTSLSWTELNASAGRRLGKSQEPEQFPVKWAHMQDNFGNAPEQWSARQDGAARLEQALGAYREAPYGDCCDSNLHGREPVPGT